MWYPGGVREAISETLMTPQDLATLSLLDPDQGVCPEGHPCRLAEELGWRTCAAGEYTGRALICWDVTAAAIETAQRGAAATDVVAAARAFLSEVR